MSDKISKILLHPIVVKRIRKPNESYGDTVEKLARKLGVDLVVKTYTRMSGQDCNCKNRKNKLNKQIPYNNEIS